MGRAVAGLIVAAIVVNLDAPNDTNLATAPRSYLDSIDH
jgi:hypothetical protein